MNGYLELFLVFAQVGACTFGGGYAMLPVLQREVVEKRGWCTAEELTDYFAIGQCTPGVIAVNAATFIGSKRRGVPGGVVATLGMVFPSVVIITLIATAVLKVGKTTLKSGWGVALFAVVLLLSLFGELLRGLFPAVAFLFSPVVYVIAAGLVGLAVTLARGGDKG